MVSPATVSSAMSPATTFSQTSGSSTASSCVITVFPISSTKRLRSTRVAPLLMSALCWIRTSSLERFFLATVLKGLSLRLFSYWSRASSRRPSSVSALPRRL